jgi:hypothetical protein
VCGFLAKHGRRYLCNEQNIEINIDEYCIRHALTNNENVDERVMSVRCPGASIVLGDVTRMVWRISIFAWSGGFCCVCVCECESVCVCVCVEYVFNVI